MTFLRRFAAPLASVPALLLLFVGISAFGIWDPWELNVADDARAIVDGQAIEEDDTPRPPLTGAVIAASFRTFGVSESSGRIPMALATCLLLLAAFFAGRKFDSKRAGIYAVLVLASSPIVLLNGRGMFGDAFPMMANGLVGLFACGLAFGVRTTDESDGKRATGLWLVGLLLAMGVAFLSAGALSGIVPPLLAVGIVAALRLGELWDDDVRRNASLVVVVLAALVTGMVGMAVVQDGASYSMWLGGAPFGGEPPTFDKALERVFHGFGAWSGLMVLALARLLAPAHLERAAKDEEDDGKTTNDPTSRYDSFYFRIAMLLWASFGYGALMLFTARYGESTYHSVAPIGIAIAVLLCDLERSAKSWWGEAVVASLFVVLILRDYALFPGTAVDSLPVLDLTTPEVFNPRRVWAGVLLVFLAMQALAFCSGEELKERPDLKAPYRFLRERWNDGAAKVPFWKIVLAFFALPLGSRFAARFLMSKKADSDAGPKLPITTIPRGWMMFALVLLLLIAVFGLACWVVPGKLPLASIAIRAGKKLLFVPVAIPVIVAGGQIALWLFARLGRFRTAPLLAAGLAVGAWTSFGFLPALSAHFSPRAVYDVYNELHQPGERLGEFRVSGRAAAYYADGYDEDPEVSTVSEINGQPELLEFLTGETRNWAVIPADQLPTINRAFRAQTERHLFVADADNARLVLITGQDVPGRENENFIARAVLSQPPRMEFPVGAKFDDKIELIGYDLETPQPGYAGAGQEFTIVWYWRALARVPGSYQLFLHVDGQGNRLNGDHEPVDGKYPLRLWDEGDVIVDRQQLTVPANYRPGPYTLWVGWFSGSSRLTVTEGEKDNANRVNAGTLLVR